MKNKKTVMAIMIAVLTIICIAICVLAYNRRKEIDANNRLNVVTSFYPVYIATLNIADNVPGVKVTNLSKPETGCLHDYQLSSDDAKLLALNKLKEVSIYNEIKFQEGLAEWRWDGKLFGYQKVC